MAYDKNQYVPVTGRNIYIDEHNRTIYYNNKTKTGYIITQEKAPQYRSYSFRYGAGVGAAVLFLVFNFPVWIACAFGVAIALMLEYRFKHSFLESCTQLKNFKTTRKMSYIETLATEDEKKIAIKILLYITLAILIPLNSILEKHDTFTLVIVSLIGIGALVTAVNQIRALLFKRKAK